MISKVTDLNFTLKSAPKRKFRQVVKSYLSKLNKNTDQFCQNTTLHGLKYLTNKDLYPRERFFFGLAFVTVSILAGYFVLSVLDKWNTNPVIFGTNPQPSFIIEEPFPAVTICNLNVAYKTKVEAFSIYSTEYAMLQMLCNRDVNVTIADGIKDWNNLIPFLTDIAQPCTNMLLKCKFGAVRYNCTDLFKPVITDEGLCCTFNMVHPAFVYNSIKDTPTKSSDDNGGYVPVAWTAENGYQANLPEKFYPRPTPGVGETLGLSLILDVESNEYYCSSMNSVGFKIAAHIPTETPNMREIGLLLSPGLETKIRLRPEKYESEQKLRKIHRRFRQCLYQNEEKLKIFSDYTQRNCELECLSKQLLKYCGCISYNLPRLHGNESICSIFQSPCVERVRIFSKLSEDNAANCNEMCLPSCYDKIYYLDFFSAPIRNVGSQVKNRLISSFNSSYVQENIASIHIYFREYSYRSLKQTEFFGGTDVLSNVGGLLGVFFGFSFISLVELVFYALIRPFRTARQTGESLGNVPEHMNQVVEVQPSRKEPIQHRFQREVSFNKEDKFNIFKHHLNIEQLYGELLKQAIGNDEGISHNLENRRQFAV